MGGGLLSFSVFQDLLLDQLKTQTIRQIGPAGDIEAVREAFEKFRFHEGDHAHIWWRNPRTCHPECYKMGIGRVTYARPVEIVPEGVVVYAKDLATKRQLNPANSETIARRDGFPNFTRMRAWFDDHYPEPSAFALIRWAWLAGPKFPPVIKLTALPLAETNRGTQTCFKIPQRGESK